MAEETKEKKSDAGTKTIVKIVIGIALVILGLWAVIGWWIYLLNLIKGCLGLVLILAGGITIAIAKE